LHSDFMEYQPIKKEVAMAETSEKVAQRLEEIVVLFTCVEQGDDASVARRAVKEIKLSLEKLNVNRILIYPYAHLSNKLAKPAQALRIIKAIEKEAKDAGIETFRTPFGWTKQFTLAVKGHPLAEQSKTITPGEVKEEEKVEWEIPKPEFLILTLNNETVLPEKYHFERSEENFRILVEKEALKKEAPGGKPKIIDILKRFGFEWEPYSDSGHMRYGPKAALMVDLVGDYAWQSVNELGIPSFSIKGTNLFNLGFPAIKEHAALFGERLYTVPLDDDEYVLKYAACFQQFAMLKDWTISYKQVPFAMFEIADSYRLEQSGECSLGFRLRRFYMPDYHIFCKDLEQAKKIAVDVHSKIYEKVRELGNDYVSLYNLTRSFFEENREFFRHLLKIEKKPILLRFVPEGKYYWVINVEYNIIDKLKRPREIATFQIDIGNAKRFEIKYTGEDKKEVYPPIFHIAILGGIERYIFTVLDTALKQKVPSLPLWLSPIQVRLIPLSDEFIQNCEELADQIEKHHIRVDLDDRPLTMQKKVREAEMEWINYIIVFGQEEADSGVLSVRDRAAKKIRKMQLQDLANEIEEKTGDKPFRPSTLPRFLSKRPQFTPL